MAKSKTLKKKKASGNPCWKGYIKLGMKIKKGKKVPDCVPQKSSNNKLRVIAAFFVK